jgi:hypothetical protein
MEEEDHDELQVHENGNVLGRACRDPRRLRRNRADGGCVEARASRHNLGGDAAQYRQLRQ